jgi:hypothetical protein
MIEEEDLVQKTERKRKVIDIEAKAANLLMLKRKVIIFKKFLDKKKKKSHKKHKKSKKKQYSSDSSDSD